jgi:hypothetical protein
MAGRSLIRSHHHAAIWLMMLVKTAYFADGTCCASLIPLATFAK